MSLNSHLVLKRIFFSIVQLWQLVFLEPVGVQMQCPSLCSLWDRNVFALLFRIKVVSWWLQLMRYIMSLKSHWFQNYQPSKLNNRKKHPVEYKKTARHFGTSGSSETLCISFERTYLCVFGATKVKGVTPLLLWATLSWKKPFYTKKPRSGGYFFVSVYVRPFRIIGQ